MQGVIKDFIGHNISSGVFFNGTYGIEIETESLKSYEPSRFTFWNVKEDGSLRNFGREYVLKAPVNYADVYEALSEFDTKTKKIKFIDDSVSTSIHVHINMLPETWRTMANFLTIYTLVENVLIEYSGEFRRNNLFCLPIKSVPYVNKLSVDIFKNLLKKNYDFRRILDMNQIKYAALNLGCLYKFGSIELRSHRGVTDIDAIFKWITIINDMLEFARADYTPTQIMDTYKLRGNGFLREIFGEEFRAVYHKDISQLLKDNLWYASNIGYGLTDTQWKTIDEKPEVIEMRYSQQRLNAWSRKIFGLGWNELDLNNKTQVIRRIKEEDAKKEIPHPLVTSFTSPQPVNINWNDVVSNNELIFGDEETYLEEEPE